MKNDNRFSDDRLLQIVVTVFIAFTMIFLYMKVLFF
jgi:hypothetical protein